MPRGHKGEKRPKARLVFLTAALSLAPIHASFGQNETERFFAKSAPQSEALGDCYRTQSVRYATSTCEPAATVVDAAFGSCTTQQRAYIEALVKNGGPTFLSIAEGIVAKVKVDIRQFLLAKVVEARLAAGRCSGNSN
jgi:hypothetical protein